MRSAPGVVPALFCARARSSSGSVKGRSRSLLGVPVYSG